MMALLPTLWLVPASSTRLRPQTQIQKSLQPGVGHLQLQGSLITPCDLLVLCLLLGTQRSRLKPRRASQQHHTPKDEQHTTAPSLVVPFWSGSEKYCIPGPYALWQAAEGLPPEPHTKGQKAPFFPQLNLSKDQPVAPMFQKKIGFPLDQLQGWRY